MKNIVGRIIARVVRVARKGTIGEDFIDLPRRQITSKIQLFSDDDEHNKSFVFITHSFEYTLPSTFVPTLVPRLITGLVPSCSDIILCSR